MGGMFGGSTIETSSPVSSLALQTSTKGRCIPVAYGKTRIPGNLIWYGDFSAIRHESSAGGKGGGTKTVDYTYTCALLMGICEGEINSIPRIWKDKNVYTGSIIPSQTLFATESFRVPSGLSLVVANASTFSGGARVTRGTGENQETLVVGADYTVSNGVYRFSEGYAGKLVKITYSHTVPSYYQCAAAKLGFTALPGAFSQGTLGWLTTKHPSQALAYRGLAYVGASSYNLGSSANLANHSFEVDTEFGYSADIRDANPKDVVADLLTNTVYGAGFPADLFGDLTQFSNYCVANGIFVSPSFTDQETASEIVTRLMEITNSAPVYSERQLKIIPYGDEPATGNGVTFTPNVTPVYDLTDDHFLDDGDDPIRVTRTSNADAYNYVQVKYRNRDDSYNEDVADASDQANIELFGRRAADVKDMADICLQQTARNVAQIILQRSLYVRNTYEFKLGAWAVLLDPMDLVTLTDEGLGLDRALVRITEIEEDEEGDFTVTAEEVPQNVCNPALYGVQPPVSYAPTFNVDAGEVAEPVIFEAPTTWTSTGLALLVAVTGELDSWGGCSVWVSYDDETYKMMGEVTGGARYGVTTSEFGGAVGVSLSGIGGQLLPATSLEAEGGQSLCFVGDGNSGEYFNYEGAALTGENAYTLDELHRGAFRTEESVWPSGSKFVRVVKEQLLMSDDMDLSNIGSTIYFKFLSKNVYGSTSSTLDECRAYAYTIKGYIAQLPPADISSLSITGETLYWPANDEPDIAGYKFRFHYGANVDWLTAAPMHTGLITESPFELIVKPTGAVTLMGKAVDQLGNESKKTANVLTNLGDQDVANVVEEIDFTDFLGEIINGQVIEGVLYADATDSFYGIDSQSAYGLDTESAYKESSYAKMFYTTPHVEIVSALAGSVVTLNLGHTGDGLSIEYRLVAPDPAYGSDGDSFFESDDDPAYPSQGAWQPWPGSVKAKNDFYQFRVTIGAGATRGSVSAFSVVIDAPDLVEYLEDVEIAEGGTEIPYKTNFTKIKAITSTLQANTSGAVAIDIDKSSNLHPVATAYNGAQVSVDGATADFILKGY